MMASRKTLRAETVTKGEKASAGRTALVVLGMHRSGTSAMAGVLGQMGCDLPQDLMGPAEINVRGFFESNRITDLNEDLLASAGHRWFSFPRFPPDWFASPKADEYLERARDEIVAEYGRSHLFVLKDPRICRLLPLWHRALRAADCQPAYVCIHRHPQDVAASLTRWANYDPAYGLLLWLRHVLDAEAESRGQTRVFTSYDRLMADWAATVRGIGAGLGIKWPRSIEAAAAGVEGFLSADLQHFRQTGTDRSAAQGLPDWIAQTYAILESWAAGGERGADHKVLDRIRAGLDQAGPSFASVTRRSQERWVEVQRLQQRIADLESAAQLADQKTAALQSGIADLTEARDRIAATAASHAINHRTEQQNRAVVEAQVTEINATLGLAHADFTAQSANLSAEIRARQLAESRVVDLSAALGQALDQTTMQAMTLAAEQAGRAAAEDQIVALSSAVQAARTGADDLATRHEAAHLAGQARITELADTLLQAQEQADARIGDLIAQRDRIQAEAAEHAAGLHSAQTAAIAADARHSALSAALDHARAEAEGRCADLAGQLDHARAALEAGQFEARDRMAEAEAALQALHGDKAALDEDLRRSDEARRAAEEDAYQQRNALIQRGQEVDDLHRQIAEDAQRFAEIDAALTAARRDHAALVQQDQRNRAHLDVLTRRLTDQLRQDLENHLKAPVDHAARERERAALIAEYETRVSALERARVAGQAALARARDDNAVLVKEAEALRGQIVQRRHEIYALTKRLDASQLELADRTDRSATEATALHDQLAALAADRDGLHNAAEALKVKLGKAGSKEELLQGHLKQRQQDVKDIREELVAVTRRLKDCQKLVATLQEAQLAQDRREQALAAQVAGMLTSASWKVTRPVRAVSQVFRRGPPKPGA